VLPSFFLKRESLKVRDALDKEAANTRGWMYSIVWTLMKLSIQKRALDAIETHKRKSP